MYFADHTGAHTRMGTATITLALHDGDSNYHR